MNDTKSDLTVAGTSILEKMKKLFKVFNHMQKRITFLGLKVESQTIFNIFERTCRRFQRRCQRLMNVKMKSFDQLGNVYPHAFGSFIFKNRSNQWLTGSCQKITD